MASNVIDVLNKRAVMHFTHNAQDDCELIWEEGRKLITNPARGGGDCLLNHSLYKWFRGELSDQALLSSLKELEAPHAP